MAASSVHRHGAACACAMPLIIVSQTPFLCTGADHDGKQPCSPAPASCQQLKDAAAACGAWDAAAPVVCAAHAVARRPTQPTHVRACSLPEPLHTAAHAAADPPALFNSPNVKHTDAGADAGAGCSQTASRQRRASDPNPAAQHGSPLKKLCLNSPRRQQWGPELPSSPGQHKPQALGAGGAGGRSWGAQRSGYKSESSRGSRGVQGSTVAP